MRLKKFHVIALVAAYAAFIALGVAERQVSNQTIGLVLCILRTVIPAIPIFMAVQAQFGNKLGGMLAAMVWVALRVSDFVKYLKLESLNAEMLTRVALMVAVGIGGIAFQVIRGKQEKSPE